MMKEIKEYYTRINDDFRVRSILWNDFMFAVLIFVFQLSGWNDFHFFESTHSDSDSSFLPSDVLSHISKTEEEFFLKSC